MAYATAPVAAFRDDACRHFAIAVQRIRRDDPALDIDEAQHFERGVDLVAIPGRDRRHTDGALLNPMPVARAGDRGVPLL